MFYAFGEEEAIHGLCAEDGNVSGVPQSLSEDFFEFVEQVKEIEGDVVFASVLTKYSSDSNYRLAIASVLEKKKAGCLFIVERIDSPQLPSVYRAIRALDLERYCSVSYFGVLCAFKIDRKSVLEDWRKYDIPYVRNISARSVSDVFSAAIVARKPCSLVRVGHCEVRFLGQGLFYGPSDLRKSAEIQWGVEIDRSKYLWVAEGLLEAIRSADMLGFRRRDAFSSRQLKVLDNSVMPCLHSLSLLAPSHRLVSPDVHFSLGQDFSFLSALSNAESIVLVTSRGSLKEKFEKVYPGVRVHLVELPGEYRVDGAFDLDERFDLFEKVCVEIEELAAPGGVFLIGGGVAGKRFCAIAKRKRAVAVDMGSMLDAWASVDSRGSGFSSELKNSLDEFYKQKNIAY